MLVDGMGRRGHVPLAREDTLIASFLAIDECCPSVRDRLVADDAPMSPSREIYESRAVGKWPGMPVQKIFGACQCGGIRAPCDDVLPARHSECRLRPFLLVHEQHRRPHLDGTLSTRPEDREGIG